MERKFYVDRDTSVSDLRRKNVGPPIKKRYPKYMLKNSSISTFSTQNIEFPKEFNQQPTIKVPHISSSELEKAIGVHHQKSEDEERGYKLSESTNSHYKNWVLTTQREVGICTKSIGTQSLPLKPDYKRIRETIVSTSNDLYDSFHIHTDKDTKFRGQEWEQPHNESYVAGAPRAVIGKCPLNAEQLGKLSITRQKFFLTQNPRKTHCLTNPASLRAKVYTKEKEFEVLTKMVKEAHISCKPAKTRKKENQICEIVDLENPMNLDFQGMDYKNTYQNDEQDIQNQRTYSKIYRYMQRKRVAKETVANVQQEQLNECLTIPSIFNVPNREPEVIPSESEESMGFMKLYRRGDKEENKERVGLENALRYDNNKKLYMRQTEEAKKLENALMEEKKRAMYEKPKMVSERNLKETELAIQKDFDYDRNVKSHEEYQPITYKRRTYPHTLHETKKLKRKLKGENRSKRDEARLKKEFYIKKFGIIKNYPEADLDISTDSIHSSDDKSRFSEESTHDEDSIVVGRKDDKFKLRGFHFKLGDNLRGKVHQFEKLKGSRTTKECLTREDWLQELTAKKEQIKVDVERGLKVTKNPDDPTQELFSSYFNYTPPVANESAVREFISKPLAGHYERTLRQNLKLVKPRLQYKVKKFNIIGYLYGDKSSHIDDGEEEDEHIETTLEYIQEKVRNKKHERELVRQKTMNILGRPCIKIKKEDKQLLCENYESSGSEWVPQTEKNTNEVNTLDPSVTHSFINKSHMPAPGHRETTLRRHPRKPRDYRNERVPSKMFDQAVKDTGIPHMRKLDPDKKNYANVRLKKSQYTKLTEARHHHDHWEPTQSKTVNVQYQPKIVEPKITKPEKKMETIIIEEIQKVEKTCKMNIENDLTVPVVDAQTLINEHRNQQKGEAKAVFLAQNQKQPIFDVYHSRTREELKNQSHPGRKGYLKLLNEIVGILKKESSVPDRNQNAELETKKKSLFCELEEDLKSIGSCISSLESSECTNFTDDSGSFLIIHGKTKLPLDYIRKSLVPFEELQHSRFRFEPIDYDEEERNPFRSLPFSGQKLAQKELVAPKDNFFTFNSRLQNGLRLRLEVPTQDIHSMLLGVGHKKYPPLVATDIDENFVKELKNHSIFKPFRLKSLGTIIKDGLRLKLQSMVIQEFVIRCDIINHINDDYFAKMEKIKVLYEKLFSKWEQHQYERTTAIVYQVQGFYEHTDVYRTECRELERQLMMINLDIAFTEGHWIRLIVLQNFLYLIADKEWRDEHDWIHRISKEGEEVELESFDVSIRNRSHVNIRKRDRDDAWAIKEYYENVYLHQHYPILVPFKDHHGLIKGVESLKKMTFIALLELHLNMTLCSDLKAQLDNLKHWCDSELRGRVEQVSRKCARKYFMMNRADDLRNRAITFINENVNASFSDEIYIRDGAFVEQVWEHVVPVSIRGTNRKRGGKRRSIPPVQMVSMMSDVIVELLGKFEEYPMDLCSRIEHYYRYNLEKRKKLSYQAQQIEYRVESEMRILRKNLQESYEKPKERVKYVPSLPTKERSLQSETKKVIPDKIKFFFHAFHSDDDIIDGPNVRTGLSIINNLNTQVVTPFYFDYFLSLNGYTPNYNFKTQVELRDGPEVDRLRIEALVPGILEKINEWEENKQKIMEENIIRNRHMYENVQF